MDYGLSPQQLNVITALSAGASTLAAAAQTGVHRNTIANWRRNSLPLQHAFAHAHYDRALAAREKAEELLDLATQTIRAILEDPHAPAGVRLRAALAILQIASTPPEPKKQVMLDIEKVKPVNNTETAPPMHKTAQPASEATAQPGPSPINTPPAEAHKLHNPAQPAPLQATPKIGRNELCPCGSRIKYKRCCIHLPDSLAAAA